MPAFPGYPKPVSFPINAGVIGIGSSPVAMSSTKGGVSFSPGIKTKHVDFDGKTSDIAGLHRVIEYDAHIKGKVLKLDAAMIARLAPGATSVTVSTVTTYTLHDAHVMYASGDYLTDVWYILQRSDASQFKVHFPVALVVGWSVDAQDKGEGLLDIDIMAVLSASETNLAKCPYTIVEET